MLVVDENMNITLTRGDSATLAVSLTSGDEPYDFSDDTVIFGVKRSAFNDQDCILEKEVDSDGNIVLEPEDTKKMEFGDYIYSVRVFHTVEAEGEGEEDKLEVYTPIVAKFSLGYNVVGNAPSAE